MKNLISKKKLNVKPNKTTIMKTTIKNPKGFEKELLEILKRNGIFSEMWRYKNFRITKTPSKKFPEMVTITKSMSLLKSFLGKRFINIQKAMVFIDYQISLTTIESGRKNVERQLNSVVLRETNW
jgi:hypothetical protein